MSIASFAGYFSTFSFNLTWVAKFVHVHRLSEVILKYRKKELGVAAIKSSLAWQT